MVYEALGLIGAAVFAGVGYNTLGIWKQYRQGGEAAVDLAKVKRNVIIGAVLGAIGYGLSLSEGVNIPSVTSIETFGAAVVAFFPLIVIAEGVFANHENKEETITENVVDAIFDELDDLSAQVEELKAKVK